MNEQVTALMIKSTLDQLLSQSLHGGWQGPSIDSDTAGNYWPEDTWNGYCDKMRGYLKDLGLDKVKIEEKISEATDNVVLF